LTDEAQLSKIQSELRGYRGIKRKRDIGLVSSLMNEDSEIVLAAKGEDGAVLSVGGERIVFAADGIIEEMVVKNPEWAGYCSVLVNVNDILAMGGIPVAAVNVISATSRKQLSSIVSGMNVACEKFGVAMVGGHLHPDATKGEISVAMIGEVGETHILSSTARTQDAVFLITDLNGRFTPGFPYSWDCTSTKSKEKVQKIILRLSRAIQHLNSCKDISNPGLIGTLAMLLEASGKGAIVDVGKVPVPKGADQIRWFKAYQGLGFVGTAPASRMEKLSDLLDGTGITVARIGTIDNSRILKIRLGVSERTVFDLRREKITGLF